MIQDKILIEQAQYLKSDVTHCSLCETKLRLNGYHTSKFHAVFTDHEIKMQRKKCNTCKKSVVPSIKSLLGTSVHPDLYRLQCEQGANFTYRKAESNLEAMCNKKREVNNHNRVKEITNQVGSVFSEKNKKAKSTNKENDAKHLILQVDGGHVKTKENDKRSFEAMIAKVYRPESVIQITEKRNAINEKTCVASAKYDKQATMKKYVFTAARAQGLSTKTHLTGLADGAKNCWGIIKNLEKHCQKLECILDWFHIAKKIEPLIKSATKEISDDLRNIKKQLWEGEIDSALTNLKDTKNRSDDAYRSKINGIYLYLKRNKEYVVNYSEKAKDRLPYTSQVAESTVEHLINDRHKRNQKMQWSRDGAHNVLQIRAAMASNQWDLEWQDTVFEAIAKAA